MIQSERRTVTVTMIKKYRINNLTFWAFEKDGAILPAANLQDAIRGVMSTQLSLSIFAELLFGGLDHVEVEEVNDEDETANDEGDSQ
jgi:hypothetical protein